MRVGICEIWCIFGAFRMYVIWCTFGWGRKTRAPRHVPQRCSVRRRKHCIYICGQRQLFFAYVDGYTGIVSDPYVQVAVYVCDSSYQDNICLQCSTYQAQ